MSFRVNHSNNAIVKPPEMTPQAAAKELEGVMKRVREAQSTIAAAIEPGTTRFSRKNNKVVLQADADSSAPPPADTETRSTSRSRRSHQSRSRSHSRTRRKKSRSKHRCPFNVQGFFRCYSLYSVIVWWHHFWFCPVGVDRHRGRRQRFSPTVHETATRGVLAPETGGTVGVAPGMFTTNNIKTVLLSKGSGLLRNYLQVQSGPAQI